MRITSLKKPRINDTRRAKHRGEYCRCFILNSGNEHQLSTVICQFNYFADKVFQKGDKKKDRINTKIILTKHFRE